MSHRHHFDSKDYDIVALAWKCRCGMYSTNPYKDKVVTREEAIEFSKGISFSSFYEETT